jgi:Fe/S biogenesis protein NfuA
LQSFEHINGATLDYSDRQGLIIRNPNKPPAPMIDGLISDDEFSASIEAVISTDVNPALAAHGGFVTFVGHDTEGIAYLTMGGGCHGCSMSKMTMLEGVQTTLVEQVPGVVKVRDITDHASGANPYYS